MTLDTIISGVIAGVITGLGTGLGAAVGTYFAQKGVIVHIEKLDEKIKKLVIKEEKKGETNEVRSQSQNTRSSKKKQ